MKKLGSFLLILVLTAGMLAGCGGSGGDSSDAAEKDTLTVVINSDPGTLDPHDNVNFAPHQVKRQIYETLVVRNDERELVPWLAESWEYEDDETLVFQIRQGVKFHNGEELKASDVLFSLKRALDDNTTGAIQVNRIDFNRCEVMGDYTVKIVTDGPYAMQLAMLENPLISMISEKAYTESGGDFFEAPIGTGPYKLVSYAAGDSVVLEANEEYWREGEPHIPNLIFRVITDASSRAIEAESGGADIVYDISANDVERVAANPGVNLVSMAGYNTSYLLFNQNREPLSDIRVREAIFLALDVPTAIEVAYGSFGELGSGIVSPGVEGRHPDLTPYFPTRDLERAKQLLEEAGYGGGLTLEIICENSNQQRMDFCEAAQAQLAEVGITLVPKFLDANDWAATTINGGTDIAIYGTTASTGEAGRILMRYAPGIAEYGAVNWTGPEAEAYAELLNTALATIDADARNTMYHTCQELLMENFVCYPIWHKEINAALQLDVQGFHLMPTYENHYLQYVYFG